MGFSKAEGEALNGVVVGIVERAISSLQGVGLSHQGACNLLITQGAIRLDDADELRRLIEDYENRKAGRA